MSDHPPVLDIEDLTIRYGGVISAVDHVNLAIRPGEVMGVIGESGSGKSTLAHSILGLLPKATAVTAQHFRLAGRDVTAMSDRERASLRGPLAAMIFQNPMTAFSPIHPLDKQLTDLLWRDRQLSLEQKRQRIIAMLGRTGIADPASKLEAYPFQISGGMLQRVAISAALLMQPQLLIADEPTTALDVTTEAQILHLMRELRDQSGVAILMISHHLGVIAELCDRVAVMYAGQIVEEGPVEAIFANPAHPYTQALLACEPALIRERQGRLPVIAGEVARPGGPGCRFAPRCTFAADPCREKAPPIRSASGEGHRYRCLRDPS